MKKEADHEPLAPDDLVPLWARVRRERLDREFDEELTTHLELPIDEGRRSGMSRTDARREAIRKLGRPVALREVHREQRGLPVLDAVARRYLRYAGRILWKSPAFTGIVTLSLALGIGANTALFSLVDDLLLRSLPVRAPERLVQVRQVVTGLGAKKVGSTFRTGVRLPPRAHAVGDRRRQSAGSPRCRRRGDGTTPAGRTGVGELFPRSGCDTDCRVGAGAVGPCRRGHQLRPVALPVPGYDGRSWTHPHH